MKKPGTFCPLQRIPSMNNISMLVLISLFLLTTSACQTAPLSSDSDSAYNKDGYIETEHDNTDNNTTPFIEPHIEVQEESATSMDSDYTEPEEGNTATETAMPAAEPAQEENDAPVESDYTNPGDNEQTEEIEPEVVEPLEDPSEELAPTEPSEGN